MCDLDPRFNIRRKQAQRSLMFLFGTVIAMIPFLIWAGPEQRANLEALTPILSIILICLTGIAGHYGYMVSKDDLKKMELKGKSEAI